MAIRKVGNDRIEIVLPKKTTDEVDDIKKKLTNVGSLEFRILANHKHDGGVADRALSPSGLTKPPKNYRWGTLGETITGSNPTAEASGRTLADCRRHWVTNSQAGRTVFLTGKNSAGAEQTNSAFAIDSNTLNTFTLDKPHNLASISEYRIEFNPSRIEAGNPDLPSAPIVREEKVAPGHTVRYILYKVDRQNVTGKLLAKADVQQDDHYQPAVGFTFNRQGGREFGTLTGDHLPEEGGGSGTSSRSCSTA